MTMVKKKSTARRTGEKPKMTLAQLKSALASPKALKRSEALCRFGATDFGLEPLPVLRQALDDTFPGVVNNAAACIAKLGPAALDSPAGEASLKCGVDKTHHDLAEQLELTGAKVWAYSGGYPNCYSACLKALVAIEADGDQITEYVHDHIGLSSPDDLVDSLTALKTVGSKRSLDLFARAVAFWLPELNKTFTKKVQALAATIK